MRNLALIWLLLCLACSGLAQSIYADKDVKDALKDADYALGRFDEVAARVDFDRLQAPGNLVGKAEDALKLVRSTYVEGAKRDLTRFNGERKPTPTELLDIMFDLERVGTELSDLSDFTSEFPGPNTSDVARTTLSGDLTEASLAGRQAMTRIFVVLRRSISLQEEALNACERTDHNALKKPVTR